MLPPTRMTAPTSEMVRPKPASTAVSSSARMIGKDRRDRLQPRRSVADQFVAIARPGPLAGAMDQRGDDGNGEDGLGNHHGGGREQQFKKAERPRVGQRQIQDQPDHDRGQTEQRVDQNDHPSPSAERINRERGATRQRDRGGQSRRHQADANRKSDNPEKFAQSQPAVPLPRAVAACGSSSMKFSTFSLLASLGATMSLPLKRLCYVTDRRVSPSIS